MFDFKKEVAFHNRYDVQVIDSATNEVKQEAHAENVVLDGIWRLLIGTGSAYVLWQLGLGTGTGTPSASDTSLFTQAVLLRNSTTNTSVLSRNEVYPTSSYVYQITVPATTSYVGNYTEIGMKGSYGGSDATSLYWSHALFEDSEGNPITITKTSMDLLLITFTVYITFGSSDSDFTWVAPGINNNVCNLFRTYTGNSVSMPFRNTQAPLSACNCCTLANDTITSFASIAIGGTSTGYTQNYTNKIYGTTTQRMPTETGNNSYYHGIILKGIGGVVFPNTNVFPDHTIEGMPIGTGDGTTTDFDIPTGLFVEDTDVVYVDGVQQVRDTDYTVSNFSNARQLKCLMTSNNLFLFSYTPFNNIGALITNSVTANLPITYTPIISEPIRVINANSANGSFERDGGQLLNTENWITFKFAENAPSTLFNIIRLCIRKHRNYAQCMVVLKDGDAYSAAATWPINDLTFICEASNDGSNWSTLVDDLIVNLTLERSQAISYGYDNTYSLTLPQEMSTTYIRLKVSSASLESSEYDALLLIAPIPTDINMGTGLYNSNDYQLPLHFTTAPDTGSIITMDVDINRPYKTDQFVIDAAMTLHFGTV